MYELIETPETSYLRGTHISRRCTPRSFFPQLYEYAGDSLIQRAVPKHVRALRTNLYSISFSFVLAHFFFFFLAKIVEY